MNEIIKITTDKQGLQVVSARELHAFLESKQQFADWIKGRIEKYGLVENQDYVVFHKSMKNLSGGRSLVEYVLSVDTAKELAMVEGNEKGRRARQYFIACEKRLHQAVTPVLPATYVQALRSYADALEEAEHLRTQNQQLQDKAEFAETIMQSADLVSVGEMAKTLAYSEVGQNKMFEFLRDKRILMPDNRPYQTAVDRGWCKVVNVPWTHPKEGPKVGLKTCFTAKGVDAVRRLLDTAGYSKQLA